MKILFYINLLCVGGAERVVANLASYLSKEHDVTVINSYKTENEYPVNEAVKRVYIDHNEYSSRIKKNIKRISFLRSWIKENKPDVCLSFMAEPNFRLAIATVGLHTKTIISVRNDPKKEFVVKGSGILAKMLFPWVDGCVFQTEDAKAFFPKRLQKKSRVIINPVSAEFMSADRKPVFGNIVMMGRLTPQKNYQMAINAFEIAKKSNQNIKLHIYGEGYMRASLEKMIDEKQLSEDIILHGHVKDVKSVLETADLYLISSDFEGMPNALMEALACGVPCIATDCPCGGPRALIKNKHNGILVGVNEVEEMATAISEVLADTEYKNNLSLAAKKSSERFAPNVVFAQWVDYIKVVNEK